VTGATSVSNVAREVIREYLRAWETADVSEMERLVAPGFEHVVNGSWEDRDGLLARVRASDAVISDRRFEIDVLMAEDTSVACRCRMTGKHTGAMPIVPPLSAVLGLELIEPTHREVSMSGMIVANIEDGRLVSGYGEWDRLGLLAQIVEAAGSRASGIS